MFFADDKFLRGLRLILAIDVNRTAIAEPIFDAIQNIYIPKLQAAMNKADERDRDKYLDMIDEWKDYGNRRSSKGRQWAELAVNSIVSKIKWKFGLSESQTEDLIQDVAGRFYTRPKFRRFIDNFNPTKNPERLLKKFQKAVWQEALTLLRNQRKVEEKKTEDYYRMRDKAVPIETEEGGVVKNFAIEDYDFTRGQINETLREMFKWTRRKLRKDEQKALFDRWLKLAMDKGPDGVNFTRDIYPEWTEEFGKSTSLGDRYWKDIKKLFIKYLRDEEGFDVGPRTLRNLKLSHSVALRYEGIVRKRFASWMLEVVRSRLQPGG